MLLPIPCRTPPGTRGAPGRTIIEFAPIFSMEVRIAVEEPFPISIMAITAAMPITMPSAVSRARVGLRRSAFNATSMVLSNDISFTSVCAADQKPVMNMNRPSGIIGDFLRVRDEDDRNPLLIEFFKNLHHIHAGL